MSMDVLSLIKEKIFSCLSQLHINFWWPGDSIQNDRQISCNFVRLGFILTQAFEAYIWAPWKNRFSALQRMNISVTNISKCVRLPDSSEWNSAFRVRYGWLDGKLNTFKTFICTLCTFWFFHVMYLLCWMSSNISKFTHQKTKRADSCFTLIRSAKAKSQCSLRVYAYHISFYVINLLACYHRKMFYHR